MKLIGKISDPRLAQAFIDYMAVKGVTCQLAQEQEHYGVYCAEVDSTAARQEFQLFAEDPLHKRYRSASWNRGDTGAGHFDYGSNGISLLHQLWVQAGPVTLVVMALCFVLSLMSLLGLGNWLFSWLHFPAPLDSQWLQFWRFLAPAFMHGDLVHLLFNLVIWWYLGGKIEQGLGSQKLLLLLLVGAFIPNLWQGLWEGYGFLGLSGVNYALIGYLALVYRLKPELHIPPALIGFMVFWMLLGFMTNPSSWLTGSSAGMANLAHLGGLLVGLAQGVWDRKAIR